MDTFTRLSCARATKGRVVTRLMARTIAVFTRMTFLSGCVFQHGPCRHRRAASERVQFADLARVSAGAAKRMRCEAFRDIGDPPACRTIAAPFRGSTIKHKTGSTPDDGLCQGLAAAGWYRSALSFLNILLTM